MLPHSFLHQLPCALHALHSSCHSFPRVSFAYYILVCLQKAAQAAKLGTAAVDTRAPPSGCLHSLYLFAEGGDGFKQISNKSIVGNLHSDQIPLHILQPALVQA